MTEEIKAAIEILNQLPAQDLYKDALQPAAKEIGRSLEIIAKAIGATLAPLQVYIWGWQQVEHFVTHAVAKKMCRVPQEHWTTPSPHVAVPALAALMYCGSEPLLADMYASLLATAMDLRTTETAHPAFVEIIRQLAPDEAKIISLFLTQEEFPISTIYVPPEYGNSGGQIGFHFGLMGYDAHCQHPGMTSTYIDNIRRLGLAEFPPPQFFASMEVHGQHRRITELPEFIARRGDLCAKGKRVTVMHEVLIVTQLGRQFVAACLLEPRAES